MHFRIEKIAEEVLLAPVVMDDVALAFGDSVPLALPLARDLNQALPTAGAFEGIIAQQHFQQWQQAAFAGVPFTVDVGLAEAYLGIAGDAGERAGCMEDPLDLRRTIAKAVVDTVG